MTRFEAILFDMDGVLWRSQPAHEAAFKQVLGSIGLSDFFYPDYAGKKTEDVFAEFFWSKGLNFSSSDIERFSSAKTELSFEILSQSPPLSPGLSELFARIPPQFPVALVSSASARNVQLFLDCSQLKNRFAVILSGKDALRAKPAPDLYLQAADKLGGVKGCLVVEDSPSGIYAARAANMVTWGVLGTASREQLLASGASRVFGSLMELRGSLEAHL